MMMNPMAMMAMGKGKMMGDWSMDGVDAKWGKAYDKPWQDPTKPYEHPFEDWTKPVVKVITLPPESAIVQAGLPEKAPTICYYKGFDILILLLNYRGTPPPFPVAAGLLI